MTVSITPTVNYKHLFPPVDPYCAQSSRIATFAGTVISKLSHIESTKNDLKHKL